MNIEDLNKRITSENNLLGKTISRIGERIEKLERAASQDKRREHLAIEAMDWLDDNANSAAIAFVFDGVPHKLFWLTGHDSFCDGVLAYKEQRSRFDVHTQEWEDGYQQGLDDAGY